MEYFNKEIETISKSDLEELQLERLKETAIRCYESIAFYKEGFDELGVSPYDIETLDDLTKLPFTTKQDLRDNYPYGMFGMNLEDVERLHASSGTTGSATVVGYTSRDLDSWGECFARNLVSGGASKNSIVQVSYGYGLFTGGLGGHEGARMLGATSIPTSSGNTKRQVQIMKDFGTTVLACTPSYALLIADTAIELGYNPAKDFSVSLCVLGAEPCTEAMRAEIQEKIGAKVIDIYGLSEVMGPGVSCECIYQDGLHVQEDKFIIEILDPETLEPLPDGEWGEVVFSSIDRDCSPLIRYRTRDISRIIPGQCECGRTLRRMDRIAGRTDDMLIIRGVNVFPSQISEAIQQFDDISSHYQITLTNDDGLDRVELKVETVPDFDFDEIRKIEALKKNLLSELRSNLQISVNLKIVEPKTIERSEGKAKRVIDLRK